MAAEPRWGTPDNTQWLLERCPDAAPLLLALKHELTPAQFAQVVAWGAEVEHAGYEEAYALAQREFGQVVAHFPGLAPALHAISDHVSGGGIACSKLGGCKIPPVTWHDTFDQFADVPEES